MDHGVLFISPHRDDADTLARMLSPVLIDFEHVSSVKEAQQRLRHKRYGAVLTEAYLGDGNWKDVLALTFSLSAPPAVIVTHLVADNRFWAEVLNLGCYDMLAQPFDTREVQRILALACGQAPPKPATLERVADPRRVLSAGY